MHHRVPALRTTPECCGRNGPCHGEKEAGRQQGVLGLSCSTYVVSQGLIPEGTGEHVLREGRGHMQQGQSIPGGEDNRCSLYRGGPPQPRTVSRGALSVV